MRIEQKTPPANWLFCGKPFPLFVAREGRAASLRFLEFFASRIRNGNTRSAYATAVAQFCAWAERRQLTLKELGPIHVAAYVEELGRRLAPPTVKQHLAALRMLLDWLVLGQVVPANPAASVRGPKHVVKRGKTPALCADDARLLLDSIGQDHLIDLRDRALIGVMTYTFARVSAVIGLRVQDYYRNGRRRWIRLHEKGGKVHEVPIHHKAEDYLDEYLHRAGLEADADGALFRAARARSSTLGAGPMTRGDVLRMIKRRAAAAKLPAVIGCHTFRATGITAYLANGGTIEMAQAIAGHESPQTTKLYDRNRDSLTLDEIERILI